jgi:ArsR family transcriptional regulator, lead/cadmium/zinc/bismuth-responsive transcriptional repressor
MAVPTRTKETLDCDTAIAMADRFKVLADPTRVRLLAALAEREICVSELTEILDMEQSAVSHQLRTLRGLHLVQYRKAGRQVYYRLHDQYIQELLSHSLAHHMPLKFARTTGV